MTRLNLPQTCLLDVSGELGKKAKAQLEEHVARYPAALLEHEVIKGQFELLRSMPKVRMSEEVRKRIASEIKQGVHRKLRQREREALAQKRWKMAYRAMAAVSGLAACLVIGAGILLVHQRVAMTAVANAERNLQYWHEAGADTLTDMRYEDVASQISDLQDQDKAVASGEAAHGAMDKLLENLDAALGHQQLTDDPTPGDSL